MWEYLSAITTVFLLNAVLICSCFPHLSAANSVDLLLFSEDHIRKVGLLYCKEFVSFQKQGVDICITSCVVSLYFVDTV